MTAAEQQTALNAVIAATIPCVVCDVIVHAIHRWQRRRAGIADTDSFGWTVRIFSSLIINALLCAGFVYLYFVIGAGEGKAYLVGGFLWLMISIPLLAMSRYQTEGQKNILAIRILAWLLKTGAVATSATYFLG